MKKICQLFFFCFSLVILSCLLAPTAQATSEIETKYDFRYQVNSDGVTNVSQKISLTNKISAVYASQYSFNLSMTAIKNIKAFDGEGPCRTEIKQENNLTSVTVYFNQQVVGVDKTLTFNLDFDSLETAHKEGEVWEITIPKIANLTELDDYQLTLAVPVSFGHPAFIRPSPIEEKDENGFKIYRFVKSQNIGGGVLATFGPFQIFDFTLFYHLQNSNLSLGETEIALPPDTAFQQISYQKIEPEPVNIRVDEDGNWLAKYQLKAKEKIDVVATGQVRILAKPQQNFPLPDSQNLEKNLQADVFWEVDNPQIKKLAAELKTARAIYNFVVESLSYNFARVEEEPERLGAVQALNNPDQAICMEFTDLFVALARAAGIPARAVDGFAYTEDSRLRPLSLMIDVLHVWPEYYDEEKKAWIPIDPTWGKTTGGIDYFSQTDLRHFAFAIHGENSQTPYPAGSYKLPASLGKDVQVAFGDYQKKESTSNLKLIFDLPEKIFWGENKKGKLLIQNAGQSAAYQVEVKIESQGLNLISSSHEKIKVMPPFSSKEIPVELTTKNIFGNGGQIKVWLDNQEFEAKIEVGSLIEQIILPVSGGLLILLTLFIFLKKYS
ncbi:hypothetical protein COT04_01030 [Candidatus Shapirobacteria bacterium CG07_land_8_20_14_0_80_39_12]|uniref:Transglutaminase-like domain-containing protein n=1 Tax=Candidatus Shapirobacteria bacterium CG07_land_8_20_14_0_80_39_12 TaxID=1974480 RepID=A0A2M6YQ71_9BACT|nr:MAG: hypothetical protein COT04_01030 [Candidatus Shapirobacteria bacterium CG07_land_8_20_14_0_80_39_12]